MLCIFAREWHRATQQAKLVFNLAKRIALHVSCTHGCLACCYQHAHVVDGLLHLLMHYLFFIMGACIALIAKSRCRQQNKYKQTHSGGGISLVGGNKERANTDE